MSAKSKKADAAKVKRMLGLLNCPFCGSTKIGFADPDFTLACKCQDCGAHGPFAGAGKIAWRKGAWQKRAMKLWLKRFPADPRPAAARMSRTVVSRKFPITTPLADALLEVMNVQGRRGRKGGAQ